ncbi:MAG TPA: hypothetical protein VM425_05795 [Myxococcota bacterium]|nr:hypothetical protein [Myxococcota bacterium]
MGDTYKFEKIEKALDAIHCTVVKIENEHGAKFDVLFEGQESLKAGQESLKADVGELKADVGELKTDVGELKTDVGELKTGQREILKDLREVKSSVGLLHTIANQHEARLQKGEGTLADHMANNS